MVDEVIHVGVLYNPFDIQSMERHEVVYNPDFTLADYMGDMAEDATWSIGYGEEAYERDQWSSVKLKPGDVISVVRIPQGGQGGGGKNILRAVAMIAIMVIAYQLAGPWGAAIAGKIGLTGTAATVFASVAAASFAMAGMMVVNAVLPPPTPELGGKESNSYGVDGPKNTSAEGVVVPIVFGKYRVGGNITDYYVKNVGDDQYLFLRTVLNDGQVKSIGEVEINDQPIANFTNVETRISLGGPDGQPNDWFGEAIRMVNKGLEITDSWQTHTTVTSVDRARFDLLYPEGLGYFKDDGRVVEVESKLFFEYRPYGSSTWQPLGAIVERNFLTSTGGVGPRPGSGGGTGPIQQDGYFIYNSAFEAQGVGPLTLVPGMTFESDSASVAPVAGESLNPITGDLQGAVVGTSPTGSHRITLTALAEVRATSETASTATYDVAVCYREVGQSTWTVLARDEGTVDRTGFYSMWSLFPSVYRTYTFEADPAKTYEVTAFGGTLTRAMASLMTGDGTLTLKKAKDKTFRYSYESGILPRGRYDFRIKRAPSIDENKKRRDTVYLQDIAEIDAENIHYIGTANLSVKVKLAEQLNGVNKLTAMVEGSVVKQFDEEGNVVTTDWSPYPCWHVLDILLNQDRGRGIAPSRIDFEAFKRWEASCIARGLEFNGIFDAESNVWDATQELSRVGHASIMRIGTKYSVIIDEPTEAEMLFNDSNIISGTFKTMWLPLTERANEIHYTYFPEDEGFKQEMIRVVDPWVVNNGGDLRVAQITQRGVTKVEQARYNVEKQLRENALIKKAITFDAPIEAIGLLIGQVAMVQHTSANYGKGVGTGRLKAGSTVSALALDCAVDFAANTDYRVLAIQSAVKRYDVTIQSIVGDSVYVTGLPGGTVERCVRLKQGATDIRVLNIYDATPNDRVLLEKTDGLVIGAAELWDTDVVEERAVVQPTATNLLLQSVNNGLAPWSSAGLLALAQQGTDPRGKPAFKLIPNTTSTGSHYRQQTVAPALIPDNSTVTGTALVKAAGYGFARVQIIRKDGTAATGYLNLATGAITGVSAGYTLTAVNEGDGWWRVSMTGPSLAGASNSALRIFPNVIASSAAFAGDGTSGILIGSAQFEIGSTFTHWIDTTAATRTETLAQTGLTTLNLAAPLASVPHDHAIWMVGPVEEIKRPFRLRQISGDGLHRRTLSFVEYNDDVYLPLGAPIERPAPPQSPIPQHVRGLSVRTPPVLPGDLTTVKAKVTWTPGDSLYAGADVYVALNGRPFEFVREVSGASEFEYDLNLSDEAEVKVVAFSATGHRAPPHTAPVFSTLIIIDASDIDAPTNLTVVTDTFRTDAKVTVSWTPVEGVRDYLCQFAKVTQTQYNNFQAGTYTPLESDWQEFARVTDPRAEKPLLDVGYYLFRVRAEKVRSQSDWLTGRHQVATPAIPTAPTNLKLNNAAGTSFSTRDAFFSWDDIITTIANDPAYVDPVGGAFVWKDYEVKVLTTGNVLIRTEYTRSPNFTYTFENNTNDSLATANITARRSFKVEVRLRGHQGQVSNAISLTVNNAAPAVGTVTVTPGVKGFTLNHAGTPDVDCKGVIIWASKTNNFTPGAGNLIYKGAFPVTINTLDANALYYYRWAFIDDFDATTYNQSAQASVTTTGVTSTDFDNVAPAKPATPTITPEYITTPEGDRVVNLVISWTASTEPDLDGYEIGIQEGAGSYVWGWAPLNSHRVNAAKFGIGYRAMIRAVDKTGNKSADSNASTQVTPAADTTPPALVTGMSATGVLGTIWLLWTNPADTDLAAVEIHESSDDVTYTLLDTQAVRPSTTSAYPRSGLARGALRYYKFKTVDRAGNKSNLSTAVNATTTAISNNLFNGDSIFTDILVGRFIAASMVQAQTFTGNEFSANANLRVGTGDNVVRLSGTDATNRLWIGAEDPASAPLRATQAGKLYLRDVEIADENGVVYLNRYGFTEAARTAMLRNSASRVATLSQGVKHSTTSGTPVAGGTIYANLDAASTISVDVKVPVGLMSYFRRVTSGYAAANQIPASVSVQVQYRQKLPGGSYGAWTNLGAAQVFTKGTHYTVVREDYADVQDLAGGSVTYYVSREYVSTPTDLTVSRSIAAAPKAEYEFMAVATTYGAMTTSTFTLTDDAGADFLLIGTTSTGSGGAPGTFLHLTDTPSTYGAAGQLAVINGTGDGLTWASASSLSINASQITGVLDVARIPVLPSMVQVVASGNLTTLTTPQQDQIGQGTVVTVSDGRRLVYKGSGPKTDEANYTVLADLTPHWDVIEGKPTTFTPSAHAHDAGDVTTGVFALARIPSLDAARIPNLDASKITTGAFADARIPSLDAAKIATGTFVDARIPSLDAGKVTTGTFADARIPNLDAAKVTTGTFVDARIPNLDAAKITTGTFAVARIPVATIFTDPTFTGAATAPRLRLTDTTDVTLASTLHAFQIGADAGLNLAMDGDEIQARNNGVAAGLYLNPHGGDVSVGTQLYVAGTAVLGFGSGGNSGYIRAITGGASNTGFLEFWRTGQGARDGYIGYGNGTTLTMNGAWNFSQRPTFNALVPWDAGNLPTPLDRTAGGTVMGQLFVNSPHGSNFYTGKIIGAGTAVPADIWSSAGGVYMPTGWIGHNGSNRLTISSNGYRNTGGTWTSMNQGGNVGASQIALGPDGMILFLAQATAPSGTQPAEVGRFDSADDRWEFLKPVLMTSTLSVGDLTMTAVASIIKLTTSSRELVLAGGLGDTSSSAVITVRGWNNPVNGGGVEITAATGGSGRQLLLNGFVNGVSIDGSQIWADNKIPTGLWHRSADGNGRLYFASAGSTFLRAPNDTVHIQNADGARNPFTFYGTNAELVMTGPAPAIYFRDSSAEYGAVMHVNSNLLYLLRLPNNGTSTTWDSGPNGRHPMTINLTNGDVNFSGNVIGWSDARLKTEVRTLEGSLDRVMQLRATSFYRKGDVREQRGFIAQEVQPVMPWVVSEDENGFLGLNYGAINVEAIAALQEIKGMVDGLSDRVEKQERRLSAIEARLGL